jgi:hypothetical protein
MKSKKLLWLIIGILCAYLFVNFEPVSCAQQESSLFIKTVSAQLVETREPVGNRTIHVYNIMAVIHNSGTVKSDQITVYFYDPEYNKSTTPPLKLAPSNLSLNPNEDETFVLQNWPTTLTGEIPINISFRPSDPNVVLNQYNSGSYVYMLSIGNTKKSTSTPGFEIAIVLVALLLFLLRKQRRT